MKNAILSPGAPRPAGPYSPAIAANGFIFVSGQGPIDAKTGKIESTDIRENTRTICENIKRLLEAAGSSMDKVVKVNVYLLQISDWKAMNEVYTVYFPSPQPARTTIQAAGLPRGFQIEIECTALA